MLDTVIIKNFKAIANATIKLSDLTVFVGNNGSGKSSVIEALQTLQNALLYGLSDAFNSRWHGMEDIRNSGKTLKKLPIMFSTPDIGVEIKGKIGKKRYHYAIKFNATANLDLYIVAAEVLKQGAEQIYNAQIIDEKGNAELFVGKDLAPRHYVANQLVLSNNNLHESNAFAQSIAEYIKSWQFLCLEPEKMYHPTPRDYSQSQVQLKNTGENLADYFSRLLDDASAGNQVLEKMRYVLPELEYLTREEIAVQKQIYLSMKSAFISKQLPSWLFSSGTLRILTILSMLNTKQVPPVVFIEEIENGLDPRTLNLLVGEIRSLLPNVQFLTTTHSPYFLDLVSLNHIVVAERNAGNTQFYRPDDDERLNTWKEKFSAGNLYTMNKLSRV
jgi:predicted ATPase